MPRASQSMALPRRSSKPATAPLPLLRESDSLHEESAPPATTTVMTKTTTAATGTPPCTQLTAQFHWTLNRNALSFLTALELSELYALFRFYDSSAAGDALPAIHCARLVDLLRDGALLVGEDAPPQAELQVQTVETVFAQAVLGKMRTYLDAEQQPALTFPQFGGALLNCALHKFPMLAPTPNEALRTLVRQLVRPFQGIVQPDHARSQLWGVHHGLVAHSERAAVPQWRLSEAHSHVALCSDTGGSHANANANTNTNTDLTEGGDQVEHMKDPRDYLQREAFQRVLSSLTRDKALDEEHRARVEAMYMVPEELSMHLPRDTIHVLTERFRIFDVFDTGVLSRHDTFALLAGVARKLELPDVYDLLAVILAEASAQSVGGGDDGSQDQSRSPMPHDASHNARSRRKTRGNSYPTAASATAKTTAGPRGFAVLSSAPAITEISLVQILCALHTCRRSRTASYATKLTTPSGGTKGTRGGHQRVSAIQRGGHPTSSRDGDGAAEKENGGDDDKDSDGGDDVAQSGTTTDTLGAVGRGSLTASSNTQGRHVDASIARGSRGHSHRTSTREQAGARAKTRGTRASNANPQGAQVTATSTSGSRRTSSRPSHSDVVGMAIGDKYCEGERRDEEGRVGTDMPLGTGAIAGLQDPARGSLINRPSMNAILPTLTGVAASSSGLTPMVDSLSPPSVVQGCRSDDAADAIDAAVFACAEQCDPRAVTVLRMRLFQRQHQSSSPLRPQQQQCISGNALVTSDGEYTTTTTMMDGALFYAVALYLPQSAIIASACSPTDRVLFSYVLETQGVYYHNSVVTVASTAAHTSTSNKKSAPPTGREEVWSRRAVPLPTVALRSREAALGFLQKCVKAREDDGFQLIPEQEQRDALQAARHALRDRNTQFYYKHEALNPTQQTTTVHHGGESDRRAAHGHRPREETLLSVVTTRSHTKTSTASGKMFDKQQHTTFQPSPQSQHSQIAPHLLDESEHRAHWVYALNSTVDRASPSKARVLPRNHHQTRVASRTGPSLPTLTLSSSLPALPSPSSTLSSPLTTEARS